MNGSCKHPASNVAVAYSLCMTGTLPGAIGVRRYPRYLSSPMRIYTDLLSVQGLLAFGLVRAHTSVLQGWQFLFLVCILFTKAAPYVDLRY